MFDQIYSLAQHKKQALLRKLKYRELAEQQEEEMTHAHRNHESHSKSPAKKETVPKQEPVEPVDYKSIFKNQKYTDNVLDYSPFNFYQGINSKRLLKGRALL